MKHKKYPAYKDSGIEWLGEVPYEWNIVQSRRVFTIVNGATPKSDNIEFWDGDIVWVTPADLSRTNGRTIFDSERHITIDGYKNCSAKLVPKNSIIITTRAPIGIVALAGAELCTNQGCKCLVNTSVVSEYFLYMLSVEKDILNLYGQGTTFIELGNEELKQLKLCIPTILEQRLITSFLNRETNEIDALIGEHEDLISLLKEKRSALITRAVTKGLDPNVKMKASGVDWLGEVPETWNMSKMRYLFLFTGGGTPSTEIQDYWGGDIPWVSAKDMKCSRIFDSELHITKEGLINSTANMVNSGTILILVRSGILKHTIPVAITANEVSINQDIKALIPIVDLVPEFYCYFIDGLQIQLLPYWRKQGATVESLELPFIKDFPMPVPPIEIQKTISHYLDEETAKIDRLISHSNSVMLLLKERRTAIITAAVTGKIDVRDEVPA